MAASRPRTDATSSQVQRERDLPASRAVALILSAIFRALRLSPCSAAVWKAENSRDSGDTGAEAGLDVLLGVDSVFCDTISQRSTSTVRRREPTSSLPFAEPF